MANLTLRDVARGYISGLDTEELLDLLLLTKAQQLAALKAFAAALAAQRQADLDQAAARSANLQQQVTDLTALSQ
jgi:hypothetical protein